MTYLLNLPFDTLKVDRSFVDNIDVDASKEGIMAGILAIANSLDMVCIAEGVESLAQVDCLQRLGCLHYQGWYFYRPTPIDQLQTLFAQKS